MTMRCSDDVYPKVGLNPVDRYLSDGFSHVRGMSSRFSTAICAHLAARQTALGIRGHVAEIGTFEGRFLIALALTLAHGEMALGIDPFTWPDNDLLARFQGHCRRWNVEGRTVVHRGRSLDLEPRSVETLLGGGPVRLWHIDGEHSRDVLRSDLDLAYATMHPDGLIVVDDMLHPEYPLLIVALHAWLLEHRDVKVLCILDRENIVAAAKFVLCRAAAVQKFESDLMITFRRYHYIQGSEWEDYFCVVLTPTPVTAEIG
jgi:hypothetical protein